MPIGPLSRKTQIMLALPGSLILGGLALFLFVSIGGMLLGENHEGELLMLFSYMAAGLVGLIALYGLWYAILVEPIYWLKRKRLIWLFIGCGILSSIIVIGLTFHPLIEIFDFLERSNSEQFNPWDFGLGWHHVIVQSFLEIIIYCCISLPLLAVASNRLVQFFRTMRLAKSAS